MGIKLDRWGRPVPQSIEWGGRLPDADERFDPGQPRDPSGKWTKGGGGGPADDESSAESAHIKYITEDVARGNSRQVPRAEFAALAREGTRMLQAKARARSPIAGLDGTNWESIKAGAYEEAQHSWGGATIDSHTGAFLKSDADAYAISVKPSGMSTTSVPENASREQFNSAMDNAKESYRSLLEVQDYHLGVFHDDDNKRIDIDPVLVVNTIHEVEAVGSATHAIGGAYHFRSGDGFWPPHVSSKAPAKAAA